ncbi:MAG: hypothetical protein SF339_18170 [Blastocatellia bacterium]|nr:hypothetical protein [Blastocatellia bacterium]
MKKQAALTTQLAHLDRRLEAANAQLNSTLNFSDKDPIRSQIKLIEREIEGVEAELDETDRQLGEQDAVANPANHRHLVLKDTLHRIDYDEVKNLVRELIRRALEDCAAGLFLLQESIAYRGELCLEAIYDELRRASFRETIHRREVRLQKQDEKTMTSLLHRIAGHFNVQASPAAAQSAETYAGEIVQKICSSVYLGSVSVIEIHTWDDFQENEASCAWFLEHFWRPLTMAFHSHGQRQNAKLLIVLVIEGRCPEEIADRHCCTELEQAAEKILPLPLRNWFRHEIEAFLKSGVIKNADPKTIQRRAERIYSASRNGTPNLICDALEKLILEEV